MSYWVIAITLICMFPIAPVWSRGVVKVPQTIMVVEPVLKNNPTPISYPRATKQIYPNASGVVTLPKR